MIQGDFMAYADFVLK